MQAITIAVCVGSATHHLPWEEPQTYCDTKRIYNYNYIFLLSSALRISVVKNLIISTKLSAGMSAKLISNLESKLGKGFPNIRSLTVWTPFGVLKPFPPSWWLYWMM